MYEPTPGYNRGTIRVYKEYDDVGVSWKHVHDSTGDHNVINGIHNFEYDEDFQFDDPEMSKKISLSAEDLYNAIIEGAEEIWDGELSQEVLDFRALVRLLKETAKPKEGEDKLPQHERDKLNADRFLRVKSLLKGL